MDKPENEEILNEEPRDFVFQAVSGVREGISIAKRQANQVPYEAALDIIYDLDPVAYEHFVELLTKRNKSDEVRFYIEKAEALSTDEIVVNPSDLITKDLQDLEIAIGKKKGKNTSLLKRKITLIAAQEYFKPRKVSEHKVLNRDFYLKGLQLPEAIEIYKDEKFVDYKLSKNKYLRLRLLHPDKEEEILGSDLIYEQFDLEKQLVRFVHIQYKMWSKNGIYFKQGSIMDQIGKVSRILCDSNYCTSSIGTNSPDRYRLPYCSGFFRPTDKQIDNDKDMTSSGYHLPMCYVKKQSNANVKITREEAKSNGLSNGVFNDLFVNGILGSKWITVEELQEFYKKYNIEDCVNSIRIHAQEIYVETESERILNQGK